MVYHIIIIYKKKIYFIWVLVKDVFIDLIEYSPFRKRRKGEKSLVLGITKDHHPYLYLIYLIITSNANISLFNAISNYILFIFIFIFIWLHIYWLFLYFSNLTLLMDHLWDVLLYYVRLQIWIFFIIFKSLIIQ